MPCRKRSWPLPLIGALLILAGCTTGVDGVATPDPDADRGWSVSTALAELPASALGDEPTFLLFGDIDTAGELAGVARPGPDATTDEVATWAFQLGGDSESPVALVLPEAVSPTSLGQSDEILDELGWNIADVSTFAEINAPPHTFSVLTGDFDESRLTAAMGAPTDGIWRIGPDDDGGVDIAGRSAARMLGQSLRTGLRDDALAVSRFAPPVQSWLTRPPGLDGDPTLSALAAAVDDQQVYFAAMVPDASKTVGDGDGLLDPFDAMTVGFAVIDGQPVNVFSYHFADEATAAANVETLRTLIEDGLSSATREPLSDRLTVQDISASGSVLTGVFTVADGSPRDIGWRMLLTLDVLAVHS